MQEPAWRGKVNHAGCPSCKTRSPLVSSADRESFYLLSGMVEVVSEHGGHLELLEVQPGEFVQVPSGAKHAFRNNGAEPAVQLVVTTP
jgi:mannose-6-phosphate isomerase-like protein (cupin superfamily)